MTMIKPSPETPPGGFDITHSEAPCTLVPGDFQSRLSATMERLGLTAQGAADYLGVPVTTIRKWIDGTRTPGAAVIRLLDVLGIVEAIAPSIHAAMLPTAIDPGQSVKPVDPGQSGHLSIQTDAPECTCAAKDMTFGRCCKVTPNADVTGLAPAKEVNHE